MRQARPTVAGGWWTAEECAAALRVSLNWLYASDVPWVPLPTRSRKGAEPRVMRRYLPDEVRAWAEGQRRALLGVDTQGKAG